jgi:hypothetical protein
MRYPQQLAPSVRRSRALQVACVERNSTRIVINIQSCVRL